MEMSDTWILGSTNAEFHADFKNDLSFHIWRTWEAQVAFENGEIGVVQPKQASPGISGQAGQADPKFRDMPPWVAKPQLAHFQMLPTPTRSPKSQKESYFCDQQVKFD